MTSMRSRVHTPQTPLQAPRKAKTGVEAPARVEASVDRAIALFRERYGVMPEHVAFAPGRANLIGDHTDYAQGLVMPAALVDGCACAIGPRLGGVSAASADVSGDAVIEADGGIEPEDLRGLPSWLRYAAGTFEVVRRRFSPGLSGANIAVASDVPTGSGLSSSAALEMSIATALEALCGLSLDPVEKARACQRAEQMYAGTPCGLMDQLVAVCGREGHAVRIDFSDDTWEHVPMPDASAAVFLMFDSAVKHANDDGGYAARRVACESVRPKLGVRSLREVEVADLSRLPEGLTGEEIDAVTHVVTENDRVVRFGAALAAGAFAEAGRLMNESHASLSETYRVSCDEVDALAGIVSREAGVHGARMTGGGFGGWVVALVDADAAAGVMARVPGKYAERTGLATVSRRVLAGGGARVVRGGATPAVEVAPPRVSTLRTH